MSLLADQASDHPYSEDAVLGDVSNLFPLVDAKKGVTSYVRYIETRDVSFRARLLESGFIKNTPITCCRRSDRTGAITVAIRGQRVALPLGQAKSVFVSSTDDPRAAIEDRASRWSQTVSTCSIRRILCIGNPNVGKTTLFNVLADSQSAVANAAGTTVSTQTGIFSFGDPDSSTEALSQVELVDLPGIESLHPGSIDEEVTIGEISRAVADRDVGILCIVDSNAPSRGLYLCRLLTELRLPVVAAFTMTDERPLPDRIIDMISRKTGVTCINVSAKRHHGIESLKTAIVDTFELAGGDPDKEDRRAFRSQGIPMDSGTDFGMRSSISDIRRRYEEVDQLLGDLSYDCRRVLGEDTAFGGFLSHPFTGSIIFFSVLALSFWALFSWTAPVVDLIDWAISTVATNLLSVLPQGVWWAHLIADGVIRGAGAVLVFLPQIAFLFGVISVLEHSGYLPRAALMMDRLMRAVGLTGRTLLPLISGYACAVPAIMATRSLSTKRERLIAMMVIPLTSCSARLPVFLLILSSFIPHESRTFGIFPTAAVVLIGLYLISFVLTFFSAAVLHRIFRNRSSVSLPIPLPPLRKPSIAIVGKYVFSQSLAFAKSAGTMIMVFSMILWALLFFPRPQQSTSGISTDATAVEENRSAVAQPNLHPVTYDIETSYAGKVGHAIEPVLQPLGFDWRLGIGIIASFAAREVFVSTMALVFNADMTVEGKAEGISLSEAMMRAKDSNGVARYNIAVALSLLVFYLIAMQCISTIAIIASESGGWTIPAIVFTYLTVLAYALSFVVYRITLALM